MKRHLKIASVAALLSLGASSMAFVWTIDNIMDGSQENPPINTPAVGSIVGTYDDVSNMLMITISFKDLLAPQTAAHVHRGARGTNGGIVFDIGVGNPKDLMVTLTESQEAELLSKLFYVNVHSTLHPGGEIRGQIEPVPEPATLMALGVGLAALAARRRN